MVEVSNLTISKFKFLTGSGTRHEGLIKPFHWARHTRGRKPERFANDKVASSPGLRSLIQTTPIYAPYCSTHRMQQIFPLKGFT